MLERIVERGLPAVPGLGRGAAGASRTLHTWVVSSERRRRLADVLHGTWLGHPLHAVLTDVVVGAWSLGTLLDLFAPTKKDGRGAASDRLIGIGLAAAVPTALAGVTDFSTVQPKAAPIGAAHGLLNTLALGAYALSWWDRQRGNRGRAVALSSAGLGLMLASAWLGGDLVYRHRVGVRKGPDPDGPTAWTAVLDDGQLPERSPRRVEVAGAAVLLYREGDDIRAMGAVCSHEGGPLDEGQIAAGHVTCPWHQSVFRLRDGAVVHGPSTHAQPRYAARLHAGSVEVRLVT